MKIVHSLQALQSLGSPGSDLPIVLTIGNFDGVHLGHHQVLDGLKTQATKLQGAPVVLTFSNHPSSVLRPDKVPCLLASPDHKVKLLEDAGVDTLVLLEFTKPFSQQSAEDFLRRLHEVTGFVQLVLGHDTAIGRDRHGGHEIIRNVGSRLGFSVTIIAQHSLGNVAVSSTTIRERLRAGDLEGVAVLLGRHWSVYGKVARGDGKGRLLGFPTANLPVTGLCLPPLGVYACDVKIDGDIHQGVANIGVAPSMKNRDEPLLEVFILDQSEDLYNKALEVTPLQKMRPERSFPNKAALSHQIAKDVAAAKAYFENR